MKNQGVRRKIILGILYSSNVNAKNVHTDNYTAVRVAGRNRSYFTWVQPYQHHMAGGA